MEQNEKWQFLSYLQLSIYEIVDLIYRFCIASFYTQLYPTRRQWHDFQVFLLLTLNIFYTFF